MCQAFSCVVTEDGRVLWEMGLDSHASILRRFGVADDRLTPDFAKCEIAPRNENYLKPDKWVFRLDEPTAPMWWTPRHEEFARGAWKKWKRQLNKILVKKPIVYPFRDVEPPRKITKKHLGLLRQWAPVRRSVRAVLRDSVGASVGASVWESVWESVWVSVWESVRVSVWESVRGAVLVSAEEAAQDSARAYAGSFFNLPRTAWKYTESIPGDGYPFQSAVDLWNMGLVPSFDGTIWRLHGGRDGKAVWKGKI